MGCKPDWSTTNLLAGGFSCFLSCRIRVRPCLPQDYWGMQKGRVQHSQQTKARQLLCYPSKYFCIFAFCIYRQVPQAQRSLFSVLKDQMLKSKDSENDCWVSVTTLNAVTMNEELFVETMSSCGLFQGNHSIATIHMGSSARLCLLTNCSCNRKVTECKSSHLGIKSF